MADLYPTPTRLGFLQDVKEDRVRFRLGASSITDHGRLDYPHDGTWTCTARVAEAYRAGWVYLAHPQNDDGYWLVRLTDAGRTVLDGAP